MAGPVPLTQKLGIREGARVAAPRAPEGFLELLDPLPRGVTVRDSVRRPLDVIVFFADRRAALERRFGSLARALDPAGGLWVAYPKKTSRVATDLDFRAVQEVGLAEGLVDNKSCAIDEVWTAVRFVVRVSDRPGRER